MFLITLNYYVFHRFEQPIQQQCPREREVVFEGFLRPVTYTGVAQKLRAYLP